MLCVIPMTEFSERLCYFGIAANLITYLTKVMHQDIQTAAKSVNYWAGVTTMMPLLGGFLADAYTGRFYMVLISTSIYIAGLCLLILSQLITSLKPCHDETCAKAQVPHQVVFFLGLYMISVASGGHKPSLESFGADQFDDNHPVERKKKLSFFNWWNSALCSGLLLAVTVIVYMEDEVSWASSFILLTVVMVISTIAFILAKQLYRYRTPRGSPFIPLLQVVVAALVKRDLPYPSDPTQLYQVYANNNTTVLCHTNKLRFLDKAAIIEEDEEKGPTGETPSPWRLATVSKVEELKLIVNMVPIWFSTLFFGICIAQTSTFFIKQASIMNRKLGNGFEIPPASILSLTAIGMISCIFVYDRILVPKLRKLRQNERGLTILQRIGIGMALTTLSMLVAVGIEYKRLQGAKTQILETNNHNAALMSVLWLAPQFIMCGVGDGFALVGLQEFFYGQMPDTMRSLGIGMYLSVMGIANFLSGLLITVVDRITGMDGRNSWFGKDLNHSRLDKFFCLLAAMSAVNICAYVFLATRYTYKNVQHQALVVDSHGEGINIAQNKE